MCVKPAEASDARRGPGKGAWLSEARMAHLHGDHCLQGVELELSLGTATRAWPHTQCVGGYAVVDSTSRGQDTGLCGRPTTPLEGRSASLFRL